MTSWLPKSPLSVNLVVDDVVRTLEHVTQQRGVPKSIRVDNGPEFISKSLDLWSYWNKVELAFTRPGKPTGHAFIESFNGKFREECLNEHWFLSLADAQQKSDEWRRTTTSGDPTAAWGMFPRRSSPQGISPTLRLRLCSGLMP